MHEIVIAKELLRVLKGKLKEISQEQNIKLNLKLSPFSHIKEESLKEHLLFFLKDKGYNKINLNIDLAAILIECRNCRNIFETKEAILHCPKCNSTNMITRFQSECWIESIEITT